MFAVVGFLLWKQAKTSAEEARRQVTRALGLNAISQHEEGKAWLERARLYQEHKDFFTASMMAARAVGFNGYGRQSQNERFAEAFPVLLQPPHPEYQEIQDLLRRTSAAFQPIWQSPIVRYHQTRVLSVAFSPDGRSLASGSDDKTIKLWDVESVVNFRHDLAGYLASGWCTLDGRKLLWTDTTDNLYKSRVFAYVNVSPFSHIGILQRKLPPLELEQTLFWHSLDAGNWDNALVTNGVSLIQTKQRHWYFTD